MRLALLSSIAATSFLLGGAVTAVVALALTPLGAFAYHVLSVAPEGPTGAGP